MVNLKPGDYYKVTDDDYYLAVAKEYLKKYHGYTDDNAQISCKNGKVICRPYDSIEELELSFTGD